MRRLLAGLLASSLLFSCGGDELTVEQQIIGAILEMERLAEAGERAAFMEMVAGEFDGQLGTLTRDEFHRFMLMQWNEHNRLHAQLFPISVRELGPGMAVAEFNALITGGRGLLPDSGELFSIRTRWVLEEGDWLLSSADWEPARIESPIPN
jgi:hypothetical protein